MSDAATPSRVVPSPVQAGSSPAPRTGWVTWLGLAVVLIAAAVLSFAALRDLSIAVRIHAELAWLLPIAVDAGASVSCAAWLSPRSPRDAARFAQALTWGLLALTVAGNATGQGMAAAGIVPPWWCAVLVGAIPPAVVGGVVHLAVLVGRAPAAVQTTETTSDRPSLSAAPALVDEDELLPAVREWIARQAAPVSQRSLRSEFGIGAERARKLLEAAA